MNELALQGTLKLIQELIARETGSPLEGDAEKRLENLLRNAPDGPDGAPHGPGFLSREVTILLADLRGFTSISAAYPAGTVLDLLNRCLGRMSEIIFRHGGSIDKFMGDSIMVLFGAVSLRTGRKVWEAALPTPNLGGPIATAGGLVFLGATADRRFRAFDIATGRELWSHELPAGGKATPMTYLHNGRQYVLIAAGGDGEFFGGADALIAFALPE